MFNLTQVWKRLPVILLALWLLVGLSLPVMVTQAQSAEDNPLTQTETAFSTNTPEVSATAETSTLPEAVQPVEQNPVTTADSPPVPGELPDSGGPGWTLFNFLMFTVISLLVTFLTFIFQTRKDLANSIQPQAIEVVAKALLWGASQTTTTVDDEYVRYQLKNWGFNMQQDGNGQTVLVKTERR